MGRFGACVVLLAALLTSGAAAQDLTDGEVLIVPEGWEVEAAPPVEADERPGPDGGYLYIDEADAAADATGEKSTVLKKKLARWKDPFTLPKSRVSCSKWAKPWPGSKICVGHKVQWRWMYCDVSLVVSGPDVRARSRLSRNA